MMVLVSPCCLDSHHRSLARDFSGRHDDIIDKDGVIAEK